MKLFANMSRILPLALLLIFSLMYQALVMSHHAQAASFGNPGDLQTIIICTDGAFREITINTDGQPVEDTTNAPHCPLCLASEEVYIQAKDQLASVFFNVSLEELIPSDSSDRFASRCPDSINCLDPPVSV